MAQGANTDFHVNGMANGPSLLWKRKLKTLFTCLDADGNGFLNRDDLPVLASKFRKYGGMTEEAMNSFTEKLSAWWDANFDKDASLSFDDFLKTRVEVSQSPKVSEDALVHYKANLEMMFHAIDLNSDGIISVPEWKVYYKAFGIHDEAKAEAIFKIIDTNGDGDMSLDEFIHGAFDFMYNQEESINAQFLGPLQEL